MDPKDLEILKQLIEAGLKAHAEGQVPFAWVAAVCSALGTVIAALWAWALNSTKKSAAELASWATKIEELSNAQRERDDTREEKIRARYVTVIDQLKTDCAIDKVELNKRIDRLEAARDAAKLQYENTLKDNGEILGKRLVETETALNENSEHLEAISILLERESNND